MMIYVPEDYKPDEEPEYTALDKIQHKAFSEEIRC